MAHAKQAEYAENMPIRTRLSGPKLGKKNRRWIYDLMPSLLTICLWCALIVSWFGFSALMVLVIPMMVLIPMVILVFMMDYHVK
jgi:hypothetical protein